MIPNEEFLNGNGVATLRAPGMASASSWLRPLAQWLGVIIAHGCLLWAAWHVAPQAHVVLDHVIQATLITPKPEPAQPAPPEPERPKPAQRVQSRTPPPLAATPLAAPLSGQPTVEPAPIVEEPIAAPVQSAPPPAPAAPPPPLVLPLFNADYLDNPAPLYPALSRRLNETGRVLLRVHVTAEGRADQVELRTSSGFERLDQSAHEAVARWRFVPAHRGGTPVAAWVLVPISFVM
jgi:protein TonB